MPVNRGSILAVALALGIGCSDNPTAIYPTTAPIEEAQLTLGPGDKVELVVYSGTRQSKATYMLDASGEIAVQYIGSVVAGGKTAKSIQDEVQQRLGDGYLISPIVSLTVLEINSRKISVLGQVAHSGSIKFTPGMTVTEAIAQSGGFAPMARKNMVKVTRQMAGKSEIYKLPVEMIAEGARPNFPVMPGDEIFVPERPW